MHRTILAVILIACFSIPGISQRSEKKGKVMVSMNSRTAADARIYGLAKRSNLEDNSLTKDIPVRCIGPTVMGGRVVDIDVDPKDATHFYVAYASGGLWVTHNNGTSFTPIFDHELVMTIGDIAVDWKHDEAVWIGTGEVNSSRSSYSGVGVFIGRRIANDVSMEKWKWEHRGLPESHHIGRIVLHPDDTNTAWVAVLGHLYTPNAERGIFKTTDGGRTWTHVLRVADNAGAVDLVIDPLNPRELYASIWQRERSAWNFSGNGAFSGVYQTLDGGNAWTEISKSKGDTTSFGNIPHDKVGRIGLAIHHSAAGKFLYAILDNQNHRPKKEIEEDAKDVMKKEVFLGMTTSEFLALDTSRLNIFFKENQFPKEYSVIHVRDEVTSGKLKPSALYDYLYDANNDLMDTPVVGAEVYVYDFETKLWTRTHEDFLDDLVFTYGYYFGVIAVHPKDPKKLYIAGVPLLTSDDRGKSWRGINPDNVHVDHHVLWIDPVKNNHIINGSDGGVQISYDDGKTFINCNTPAVGQFYTVQIDNATPYNVYGGLQDNGVWVGSSDTEPSRDWLISGHNPFTELISGDGMQVMVDTRDNETIYTGYQFGNYSRVKKDHSDDMDFQISHKLGEKPLRWNWQTPILLSIHNQDIFYICSNKVHRSLDRGENFETLSEDLTVGGIAGNVPYGTLTSIAESSLQFGLLAVGSDDGLVHISVDNGYNWKNASNGLPSQLWISRVIFSTKVKNRIYVTCNGYRTDHFTPYIFMSENLGATWKNIGASLPMESVNVLREDPVDDQILYVGTDNGLYISFDRGSAWSVFSTQLPAVAVHDLVIQEREKDLVIGTHGRSIWIADLEEIQQLNKVKDSLVYLFDLENVKRQGEWGGNWSKWLEPMIPRYSIPFYSSVSNADMKLECWLGDSLLVYSAKQQNVVAGLNYFNYDFSIDESVANDLADALNATRDLSKEKKLMIRKADNGHYYLPKATYTIALHSGEMVQRKTFSIK